MTSSDNSKRVQPGGTLAILGGGQLGRMMAMAARTMGYHIRVMDPEQRCPATSSSMRPLSANGTTPMPRIALPKVPTPSRSK